nr:hypothetical protein [Candidatus Sigynarchaeum springense]
MNTPGTNLDGCEVSAGVVDEVMFRYKDVYRDLGFGEVSGSDPCVSKRVTAGMFARVIVNFNKFYPWRKYDGEMKDFYDFIVDCKNWCQERHTSLELVIG